MRRRSPGVLVGVATFVVVLASLTVLGTFHRGEEHRALEESLRTALRVLVPSAPVLFTKSSEEADAEIRLWAAASGLRVTLIAADGRVHADSWTLPALLPRLENHLQRPEVVGARSGEVGVSRRRSATTDHETTYVARAVGPIDDPEGYLRLAHEEPPHPWPWGSLLVALLAGAVAGLLTRRWAERTYEAAARHLAPWSDLPPGTELEALAEEADRRFLSGREALTGELEATRAALERVSEGVMLLDRAATVRFANLAARELVGDALTVGRALVEVVRVPEVLSAVQEVLAHGGTQHTSVGTTGGAELAVRVCAVPHPFLAAAVVLTDVRGERQLERARRALVADLAHELRTPLTVLSGLAEELATAGGHEDLSASMGRQVSKLRVFAQELEELARIESGQVALVLDDVDAAVVARQAVADLRALADRRRVVLAVVGVASPLRSDPVRLAQVLGNLLDNGIRYNREGGHVTVRTAPSDGGVRIEVEDDGIGIPAAEIPLVFQRFYRVRRLAEEEEGGSGLGLAIVKHLVRALGGTVNLASREGNGTIVTLLLPAVAPAPAGH